MQLTKLNQRGIGLVETLAALGITMIILTSLVSLALFTLRVSLNSKLLLQGTKLASQEIELVRAARDNAVSWSGFINDIRNVKGCNSNQCYMTDSLQVVTGQFETNPGNPDNITRSFTIEDRSGDWSIIRVRVTVSWEVGGMVKHSYNYTDLSNWREL